MSARGQLLGDAWYLDRASGALSEGARVLMDAHTETSAAARRKTAELDAIGGALLSQEAGDVTSMALSADDIFALDDARSDDAVVAPANDRSVAPADTAAVLPSAVKDFLRETESEVKWTFLGPGLQKAVLWTGEPGEKLWLLRAQGGESIPRHGHSGSELTLVLQGSFMDGETEYRPGDVEEADPSVEHDIQIVDGEECICLAYTHGKLRYDQPLLKMFQVFTGL